MRTARAIISCTTYEKLKYLLRHFFTVLLHEIEGDDDAGNPRPCENSKIFLRREIANLPEVEVDDKSNFHMPADEDDDNMFSDCDQDTEESSTSTSVSREISAIYKYCEQEANVICNIVLH